MSKPLVDWGFSCGRYYLTISDHVVAMEGDMVRDFALSDKAWELYKEKYQSSPYWENLKQGYVAVWSGELIKWVVAEANGGTLPHPEYG